MNPMILIIIAIFTSVIVATLIGWGERLPSFEVVEILEKTPYMTMEGKMFILDNIDHGVFCRKGRLHTIKNGVLLEFCETFGTWNIVLSNDDPRLIYTSLDVKLVCQESLPKRYSLKNY